MSDSDKDLRAEKEKKLRGSARRLQKKAETKSKKLERKIDKYNKKLASVAPELASEYAKYPMSYPKWLNADATYEDKPCFIKAEKDEGMKMDYVFGTVGPNGHGYYHLLTRFAYNNLKNRLIEEEPILPCCGNKKAVKQYNAYLQVMAIVKNRLLASRPDDVEAKKDGAREKDMNKQTRDAKIQHNNEIVAKNVAAVAVTMGTGAALHATG